MCNTDLIEYVGESGSFRNTTIDGQINGIAQAVPKVHPIGWALIS
jgi:hypothetical protein